MTPSELNNLQDLQLPCALLIVGSFKGHCLRKEQILGDRFSALLGYEKKQQPELYLLTLGTTNTPANTEFEPDEVLADRT